MGRLGDALRRRLRPRGAGAPPATLPGAESGEEAAVAAAAQYEPAVAEPAAPEPEAVERAAAETEQDAKAGADADVDAGDRIDAARERLRARIEPPDPDAD
jgi:hypothetical protein